MGREIVQDDDVARFQRRGELGLDIGLEDASVHGRVNHKRSGEGVAAKAGDEGLGLPMSERGLGKQSLSLGAAAAQARHLGGRPGLVQEHQSVRLKPHAGLTRRAPFLPRLLDVGPVVLACPQSFF